jgi:hypothetical protein
MQIKPMRYDYIPTRMPKIQSTENIKCWMYVEQEELSFLLVEVQNGTVTFEDTMVVCYKTKHSIVILYHNPVIMIFDIY